MYMYMTLYTCTLHYNSLHALQDHFIYTNERSLQELRNLSEREQHNTKSCRRKRSQKWMSKHRWDRHSTQTTCLNYWTFSGVEVCKVRCLARVPVHRYRVQVHDYVLSKLRHSAKMLFNGCFLAWATLAGLSRPIHSLICCVLYMYIVFQKSLGRVMDRTCERQSGVNDHFVQWPPVGLYMYVRPFIWGGGGLGTWLWAMQSPFSMAWLRAWPLCVFPAYSCANIT